MPYTLAVAGTTTHTVLLAESLRTHQNFTVELAITPSPKPSGRTQALTPNPLHQWALNHELPAVTFERSLTEVRDHILATPQPDFLLVVDFGYLVPSWLLGWPRVAPINVHPSALPRWRGSSPGQFALLTGENPSAVSVMTMSEGLDEGPLLWQQTFEVLPSWTQLEYYQHSFELTRRHLPEILAKLAQGLLQPKPQPPATPTPIARKLSKSDAFVPWSQVTQALQVPTTPITPLKPEELLVLLTKLHQEQPSTPLLESLLTQLASQHYPQLLSQAIRAFSPWPHVWSLAPTTKGERRVQLLTAHLLPTGALQLDTIKLEGQTAGQWSQLKNSFLG